MGYPQIGKAFCVQHAGSFAALEGERKPKREAERRSLQLWC